MRTPSPPSRAWAASRTRDQASAVSASQQLLRARFEWCQVVQGAAPARPKTCVCSPSVCPAWLARRQSCQSPLASRTSPGRTQWCQGLAPRRSHCQSNPLAARRRRPAAAAGSGAAPPVALAAVQQQQQQLYGVGTFPGGFAGPAGGVPAQMASLNPYLLNRPASAGAQPLPGVNLTSGAVLQPPGTGGLPYAVPGGSLGAQVSGDCGARRGPAVGRGPVVVLWPPPARLRLACAGACPRALPPLHALQGEPPAKRQAIDPRLAQYQMQQAYQLPGGLGVRLPQQQTAQQVQASLQQQQQLQAQLSLLQQQQAAAQAQAQAGQQAGQMSLLQQLAAVQQQGLALGGFPPGYNAALAAQQQQQLQAQAQAYAMRVAVDKGRATEYDTQFVAEDTTAKDHADEVMRRCEEVTQMLRKTLGKHTDGDRCAGEGGGWGERGRGAAAATHAHAWRCGRPWSAQPPWLTLCLPRAPLQPRPSPSPPQVWCHQRGGGGGGVPSSGAAADDRGMWRHRALPQAIPAGGWGAVGGRGRAALRGGWRVGLM